MHKPLRKNLWLLALAVSLSAATSFAAPVVFGETASVKVRPDFPARDDRGVDLIAARNEFVSFQVVVHGNTTGATGVTAAFDQLTGSSVIGADQITLYREALINITQPSGANGSTGMFPDGLVPDTDEIAHEKRNAFPFDVPANQARAIWVDVHVPADAAPGQYQGSVKVTSGAFTAQVPVRLTVVGATMPSTSSLPSAFLIFTGNVCVVQTGTSDCGGSATAIANAVNPYQQLALDHRITLTNFFVVGRQGDNWPAFDSTYSKFLDGTADTRLKGAKITTAEIMSNREPAKYAAWAQHFKQKGWFDRLFDYTGDEPPYGISWDEAKARAQQTRSADPDIHTLLTETVQGLTEHGMLDLIDNVTPVINHMDGVAAPYLGNQRPAYDSFLAKPNKKLWMYQSCMSHGCAYGSNLPENSPGSGWASYMIDKSAAKNRAMQWLIFKYNAGGELYYETANALPNAWTDQFLFAGNGDGTLFYPGTPSKIGGTTTVPLPSIRLKQIRQGMQDYEWLKLVSDAGDPAFAKQIVDQLVPSTHQVGDDGAAFDAARAKLITRYVELTAPQQVNELPQPGTTTGTGIVVQGEVGTNPTGTNGAVGTVDQPISNTDSATTPPGSAGSVKGGCAASPGEASLIFAAFAGLMALRQVRRRRNQSA